MSTIREMLRIGICDNEEQALLLIKETLEEQIESTYLPMETELCTYLSGGDLLKASEVEAFQLVFLDIEMPEQSGFHLAHKLQLMQPDTRIVFVSNHEGFVYDSFDYVPLRFVRKQYLAKDLEKALQKYIQLTARRRLSYKVSDGCGSRDIHLNEIYYFECNAHDIMVVTKERTYHTYGSLKAVERELEHGDFIRVHRNYLLNKEYIGHVGSREIELLDGTHISMGRGRKKMIQEELSVYDRRLY